MKYWDITNENSNANFLRIFFDILFLFFISNIKDRTEFFIEYARSEQRGRFYIVHFIGFTLNRCNQGQWSLIRFRRKDGEQESTEISDGNIWKERRWNKTGEVEAEVRISRVALTAFCLVNCIASRLAIVVIATMRGEESKKKERKKERE